MGQVASDSLPCDISGQKQLGLLNPDDGNYSFPMALGVQSSGGKSFASMAVLSGYRTERTHDALTVGTEAVKRGTQGSPTAAIDARGFTKGTIFANVSGLGQGATLTIALIPRFTQTGDDYTAVTLSSTVGNGRSVITFDLRYPFYMLSAAASSGTATVTIDVYQL